MPLTDKPSAAPNADDSLHTSEQRRIIVGYIAFGGAVLVILAAGYIAFNWALGSPLKLYVVAGGATAAMFVLGIGLNRYAPPPKDYPARRIENKGPAWAIGRVLLVLTYCVALGFVFDNATRSPWDIWKTALALLFIGLIVVWSQEVLRWVKARRAGQEQGRADR
jgi:hypothetical protein